MLEYPESHYMAKQINEGLIGKQICDVELLHTPHKFAFFWGETDAYPMYLVDHTIRSAQADGGILRINTEDSMVLFSDGSGPRYSTDPDEYPKNHQFLIRFTDGSAITSSIKMYGMIGVHLLDKCDEAYYNIAAAKPGILTSDFTFDYFMSVLEASDEKKLSAKAFLATKQRFPGLGNGVLQDVLWNAGIHPKRDVYTLSESELTALYNSVCSIIREMTDKGGRDVERTLYGEPGGYHTILSAKTLGQSCTHCGHEIEKCAYMGGAVYYCNGCQK